MPLNKFLGGDDFAEWMGRGRAAIGMLKGWRVVIIDGPVSAAHYFHFSPMLGGAFAAGKRCQDDDEGKGSHFVDVG